MPVQKHPIGQALRDPESVKSPVAPYSSADIQRQINSPLNTLIKRITHTLYQAAVAAQQLKDWVGKLAPSQDNIHWATALRPRTVPRATKGHDVAEQPNPVKRKDGALQWLQQIMASALTDLAQMPKQVNQWCRQAKQHFNDNIITLMKKHTVALTRTFAQLTQQPMAPSAPADARALHQKLCDHKQDVATNLQYRLQQPEMMEQFGEALLSRYKELFKQQQDVVSNGMDNQDVLKNGTEMTHEQICDVCVEQLLLPPPAQQQYAALPKPSQRAVLTHYSHSLTSAHPGFFNAMRNNMVDYMQKRHQIYQIAENCAALDDNLTACKSLPKEGIESVLSLHQQMIQLRMVLQQPATRLDEDEQQQHDHSPTPFATRPSLTPQGG
ncbi:MAG: hypothetical protein GKR77_06140 [Legionellales bacterium]|nr:hypothetical protein [Legionellales bacterium]